MGGRQRIILLIVVLFAVAAGAGGVALAVLYDAAIAEQTARLRETARSRARLIEAVARYNRGVELARYPAEEAHARASEATLEQVREAHGRFEGFGRTGEFTLARQRGDRIVFLLSHRHGGLADPAPVPLSSALAEPMQRALAGESGTLTGRDYRGEIVLAAHEPVAVLDLGIVAKIDLAEVRAPFVHAGLMASGIGLALVGLGAVLFLRIGNPMVRCLEEAEKRLTLQLAELNHLYAVTPLGLCQVDSDLRFVRINDTLAAINGRKPEEHIGRAVRDVLPEIGPQVERIYRRVIETGQAEMNLEIRGRTPADPDSERDWLVSYYPVGGEDGRLRGVGTVVQDITEQKRTRQRLEHLNAVLRAVRDVNQLITQQRDPTTLLGKACDCLGATLGYHNAWAVMLDRSGELADIISAGSGDLPPPLAAYRVRGEVPPCIRRVITPEDPRGEPLSAVLCSDCPLAPAAGPRAGLTTRLEHAGNVYGAFCVTLPPAFATDPEERSLFDELTADIGFALYRIDLEARREAAETALRHSRQRYAALFNQVVDGIYIADLEGRLLEVNDAACERLGYTREELLGMSVWDVNATSQPQVGSARFEEIREKGCLIFETEHRTREGRCFPVELNTRLIDLAGRPAMLGIARDITDRKRVEAIQARHRDHLEELVRERTEALEDAHQQLLRKERLAALGQLIATVSHEMRNPLGTVRTCFYTLRERLPGDDPDLERILKRADRNIQRCDRIIQELLDYTRAPSLQRQRTDLDRWLHALLDEYELPKGVELDRRFAAGAEVPFDRDRFGRCVLNVVQNAVQAVQESGVRARRVVVGSRLAAANVEIRVADTGPGMDRRQVTRMFEPLFSTKSFGVGLGMPIVRQIMRQHQGGVEVESEPGRGTAVTLWLPLAGRVTG